MPLRQAIALTAHSIQGIQFCKYIIAKTAPKSMHVYMSLGTVSTKINEYQRRDQLTWTLPKDALTNSHTIASLLIPRPNRCVQMSCGTVSTRINEYQRTKNAHTNPLVACTSNCPNLLLGVILLGELLGVYFTTLSMCGRVYARGRAENAASSIDEDGPCAKRSRYNSNMSITSDKPDDSDSECSANAARMQRCCWRYTRRQRKRKQ